MENNNTNKENKNWIKAYIVDVLPCISIAFFVLAYVYNAAYFSVFDIDILKYATFGDIFITITEPLCLFALSVALLMAISYRKYTNIVYDFLKEEKKNSYKIKLPYSWLRFIIKARNNKIVKIYNSIADSLYFIIIHILKFVIKFVINFFRKIIPEIYAYIVLLFFLGAISETFFFYLLEKCNILPTLSVATPALILPLLIIPLIVSVLRGVYLSLKSSTKVYIKNWLSSIKSKSTLFITIACCYYIYAIAIFMDIGVMYGKNQKEHNYISFVIKTSDGNIFDNKSYGYIAHLSETTFLFSKKDHENVVLFNENITYTKIKEINYDKKTYNIIVSSFSTFNKKINNYFQ